MATYSCGSTTKPAFCDWKKLMTSCSARAASSWDGVVIGDGSLEEPLSSVVPVVPMGTGGGCIEFVTCVGDRDMVSSMTGRPPGISAMGESSVLLLMYFGVRASVEPGGDMYCSTPTSMGKVWLRGLWKLALPGWPLAGWRFPTKGFGPHAESGVKKGDESEVGLVGPAEKDEGALSVKTLDKEVLLCE